MSDKDCPDKLEPAPQHILTSVLKNVPIELMWHLREYHSKPSYYTIRWRARQPYYGKKYGKGGELKFEDAQSADMYVTDEYLTKKHSELSDKYYLLKDEIVSLAHWEKDASLYRDRYITLKDKYDLLKIDYERLEGDLLAREQLYSDTVQMDARYNALQAKYDDIN